MPKDRTFFDHFEELGRLLERSTSELSQSMSLWPASDGHVSQMEQARHEAHRVVRESLLRLDTAFITPFDREDILELSSRLYEVIAVIATSGRRMELYKLEEMHPSLRSHTAAIEVMARELASALRQLRKEVKLTALRPNLDEIGRQEEQARQARDRFLLELYSGQPDALQVMKKREVHDLMLEAIYLLDNLGRTVERILLKND
ncbi:DUF47 domain-containing protein [Terriglobus aquaticus]|uniref:DUF47 domain-containing protein n=1 Tax=Terriglobus aquaticus TaxID=940139 RepID=A0ABW9KJW7_9BACT|nr:DUF47 family protein [Terriglobus aquaticus]